jgi:hypothetical protein
MDFFFLESKNSFGIAGIYSPSITRFSWYQHNYEVNKNFMFF